MKRIVKYTFAFILIFCINNNLFAQADEDWVEIDSYVEGRWEGNAISPISSDFIGMAFKSQLKITMTFDYKKGDANVFSIVKIDLNDFLTDLENMKGMKKAGYTKESMWEIFKEVLLGSEAFIFDDYSIFFENTALASKYFASDSLGKFLMNKNKDRLLLTYSEPYFILGIGDAGFTKMIFRKIN